MIRPVGRRDTIDTTSTLAVAGVRQTRAVRAAVDHRWLLLGAFVVFVIHLYPGLDAANPVVFEDEIGYLLNARAMAGQLSGVSIGPMGTYSVGWSIAMVPLALVFTDPYHFYRAVLVLAAVTSAVSVVLLYWILRQLTPASKAVAAAAATAALLAPGLSLMSGYAYAESWFVLVFLAAAASAIRWFDTHSRGSAATFGFFGASCYITHGRGLGVLLVTLVALLLGLPDRSTRRSAAVGVGVAVLTAIVGRSLQNSVESEIYLVAFDRLSEGFQKLFDPPLRYQAATFSGQFFTLSAGTLGLSVVGLAIVLRRIASGSSDPHLRSLLWILLAAGSVYAISALSFGDTIAEDPARLDYYVYGRYVDSIGPLFAGLGLVGIATATTRRRLAADLSIAAVSTVVALGALLLLVGSDQLSGRPVAALSIAGLAAWMDPDAAELPLWPPLLATIGVLAAVGVRRGTGSAVALSVGVAFAALTAVGEIRTMRPLDEPWQEFLTLDDQLVALQPDAVSFDDSSDHLYARNGYQFLLTNTEFFFDAGSGVPSADVVVAARDWAAASELGARRLGSEKRIDQSVWVLPGGLQDDLAARGMFALAADEVLPPEARQGTVSVSGLDDGPGEIDITLRISHDGAGAPWHSLFEPAGGGTVRVHLVWLGPSGEALGSVFREPTESLYPGQTAQIPTSVSVPAGATTLRLELFELDRGAFGEPVEVPVAS